MRVLLCFPMKDLQTGAALLRAFENLGHTVKVVDAKTNPNDSIPTAFEFKPDLVFCSRTQALTWKVQQIKNKFKNVVTCVWNVDVRSRIKRWVHLFPLIESCDYHFVPDTRTIPQWKKINNNTFWLPQGLQDEVYDKPKEITTEDKEKYGCDVSFAGSLEGGSHNNRGQYLNAIRKMDISFKLWGCYGIPRVYNEEHNKMVSLSKINLCCSAYPQNGKVTSVRNYKVMGAGGFMLELWRDGIGDMFPPDSFDTYNSPEYLVEKIRFWLEEKRDRKDFAERGYQWVRENATYTHRIKTALEIMGL